MKEREEAVKEIEETEGKREEDEVPKELRLAYRDELDQKGEVEAEKVDKGKGKAAAPEVQQEVSTSPALPAGPVAPAVTGPTVASSPPTTVAPRPTATGSPQPLQRMARQSPDRTLAWIDTCIWGVVAALLFMVVKKFEVL